MEKAPIFGRKIEGLDYRVRKGVYAVIFNSSRDKIATVRTLKGHFLLGGGMDDNETLKECLSREVLEETGYEVTIGAYIGRAKKYFISTQKEPLLSDSYFYLAHLSNKKQEPVEKDHFLEWVSFEKMDEVLVHDHQAWGVKEGFRHLALNRVEHIRKEEKNYHDHCYDQYELFKEGSWLHKPVKTVLDLIPFIQKVDQPKVLDLGSGVGRNSIPIAQAIKDNGGQVVCVDLLDSALEKLIDYSETYQVRDVIESVKADIGDYQIKPNEFDFIIAVSSLEHVVTEEKFERVIQQMAAGTKVNGINCLVVNSEVEEMDLDTNESLDALMEVNLPTEKLLNKLRAIYRNWDILQTEVKRLEYTINRGEKPVLLKTKAVTFVVKKSGRSDN